MAASWAGVGASNCCGVTAGEVTFDAPLHFSDAGLGTALDAGLYAGSEMSEPKPYRVAVYCASAIGIDPAYKAAATEMGRALAGAGIGVVYGGAKVGLMGAVADAALGGGAEVIGVLPEVLVGREIAHPGLTRLIYTATMHERKAAMIELADAVIALPGGFGTLDELMEALTWAQLGIHAMRVILVNTLG